MATHLGSEGEVNIGANTIAEVVGWSMDQSANVVDDTAMGDTDRTYKSGTRTSTGTITCHWDETDTNGQGAMTVGAEVTLNLYPEGSTSGDSYWTGSVIITGVSRAAGDNDSIISATYNWQANGAMTLGTVA